MNNKVKDKDNKINMIDCKCCKLLSWDYLTPEKRYYVDKSKDPRKAGGILIYKGRVLLVQSRGNKWGFPKGGFEGREDARKCAIREVLEETSFNISISKEDMKVKYNDTSFFIKHLTTQPPEVDEAFLKTPGNDCTGIGWVRLTCLRKMVNKATNKATNTAKDDDLTNKLESLEIGDEMMFNSGIRKFVSEYLKKK